MQAGGSFAASGALGPCNHIAYVSVVVIQVETCLQQEVQYSNQITLHCDNDSFELLLRLRLRDGVDRERKLWGWACGCSRPGPIRDVRRIPAWWSWDRAAAP